MSKPSKSVIGIGFLLSGVTLLLVWILGVYIVSNLEKSARAEQFKSQAKLSAEGHTKIAAQQRALESLESVFSTWAKKVDADAKTQELAIESLKDSACKCVPGAGVCKCDPKVTACKCLPVKEAKGCACEKPVAPKVEPTHVHAPRFHWAVIMQDGRRMRGVAASEEAEDAAIKDAIRHLTK